MSSLNLNLNNDKLLNQFYLSIDTYSFNQIQMKIYLKSHLITFIPTNLGIGSAINYDYNYILLIGYLNSLNDALKLIRVNIIQ